MLLNVARDDEGAPEIFRSIQGEGRNCGRQRTFIRLSGCNLHCVWCDTAYTWNWRGTDFHHERDAPGAPHKFDRAKETVQLSSEEAATRVLALPSEGLVITGGEPLVQRAALPALIDAIKAGAPSMLIEIETNGSIAPPPTLVERVDLFMVSPKLAHSGNEPGVALRPEALGAYASLPSAMFKFVARSPADVEEAAVLAQSYGIGAERIYVMPEGSDSAALSRRSRELVPAIVRHGVNYSPRLHVDLFGQKRGV
ncbi:MAG: 7-carboxy-7-deazaguanine synthase QueE [Hyphomonadaceae bacterium]|nr:7-carboxy-7-deazaguanine synthase QueE [Hyphomonadaceae bacterium]